MLKLFYNMVVLSSLFVIFAAQMPVINSKAETAFEDFQLQHLYEQLVQLEHQQSMQKIEKKEVDKLLRAFDRKERVKKYKALLSGKYTPEPKVAFIGECAVELSSSGFDPEKLADLLELIREDKPQALFLTGNIVYGLELDTAQVGKENVAHVNLPPHQNIFKMTVEKLKGYYNSNHYKQALENFISFLYQHLGDSIPVYPLMGALDSIGPDAAEIFVQAFHLENIRLLSNSQLVYAVSIDNALFILLSTDYYDKHTGEVKVGSISDEALSWLENILETQAAKFDHVFVVGSDPVFSTRGTFGIYRGLDVDKITRDKLWDIFYKYNIRAYLCGGEVVYDRSYRKGGWQIITGGGGTPAEYLKDTENTFYHFLLMTLPKEASLNPLVTVIDQYGLNRDAFSLTRKPPLIYDYRISRQE